MSALRASPSPSPSPAPGGNNNPASKANSRASMGPQSRTTAGAGNASNPSLALPSPRPGGHAGGGRPTSELLGTGSGAAMFQSAEADAIDQWFENLQNYEVTLEEMAAASLDVNFKEELSAIEQWFRVLSEAERTAALYSLLQQSTQVQIRFFITVLQQMARSDPMTALLSPAAGGSMQAQMEAKLASLGLKSPAIGGSFPTPASPSTRNFGRQSLAPDSPAFLSPESANTAGAVGSGPAPATGPGGNTEAAATLAHQRAKLQSKANAAHRISAPVLANSSLWSPSAGNPLSQVAEQESSNQGSADRLAPPPSAGGPRPKSMDLSSLSNLRSPRGGSTSITSDADGNDVTMSPVVGGNWASMVNTPAAPMFEQDAARAQNNLDAATMKLFNNAGGSNNGGAGGNRFVLDDPKAFRRKSTSKADEGQGGQQGLQPPQPGQPGQRMNNNNNNNGRNNNNFGGWNGARSPGLSSSGRFDNNNANDFAALGLGSPGLMNMNMNMMGGIPGLNMGGMIANLNALAAAGGISPEAAAAQAQFLAAAQMAAFTQPGMMGGMGGMGGLGGRGGRGMGGLNGFGGLANVGGGYKSPGGRQGGGSQRGGGSDRRSSARVGGGAGSVSGGGAGDKPDEEVDPALLEDVPQWLRTLRLHKYTPNFEGMDWRQMVVLSEAELEAKGVAALGARRKMLKTFEVVRLKMGIAMPGEGGSN